MTSSRSNKRGFTLVELLAVITIMAIMVAVSLPALRSLQGTALQTAARQVQNDMMLARQYAVTGRLATRFCIATTYMSDFDSNTICRAYMVVRATNSPTTGLLVGYVPLTDWRFLPDGIIFSDKNDQGGFYNPLTLDPMAVTPGLPTVRNLGTAPGSANTWQYFSGTNTMTLYVNGVASNNWRAATVDFAPTGYVTGISGAGGSIRLMQGSVANPQTRELIVTDTNNWVNIEYDQFGGRVRLRYRDSYQ